MSVIVRWWGADRSRGARYRRETTVVKMMRKRSHDERRATVARGPRMTSERHRCRVLRRRIEALELAGDPAPTTPRCLSTSRGRRLCVKGATHHHDHRCSPTARPATHFVRGIDLVIVAELSGFPGYTRMPAAKRVPGRRRAPAASGKAGAGLAEGTTGCHSRPSGSARLPRGVLERAPGRRWDSVLDRPNPCDRRLEVVAAGRRVAGPVDRRTIPRSKSAGEPGGAVASPSARVPQRTLGYSRARGMVRNGECAVEHTPIAAGRRLADD